MTRLGHGPSARPAGLSLCLRTQVDAASTTKEEIFRPSMSVTPRVAHRSAGPDSYLATPKNLHLTPLRAISLLVAFRRP